MSDGPQSAPRPITRPTVNIRAKHVRLYDEKTGDYFDLEADDQNSSFILNLNCESNGGAEVGRSGNVGTCTYLSPVRHASFQPPYSIDTLLGAAALAIAAGVAYFLICPTVPRANAYRGNRGF
jgi:hypothetical protein